VKNQHIRILSVSPMEHDHEFLERSFTDQAAWSQYTNSKPELYRSPTITSALRILRETEIPVILCEQDVYGTWREMLERISHMDHPPYLVVTARLADEHLWAEALNVGAYDVLSKPFNRTEVIRIVSLAWLHWEERREPAMARYRPAASGTRPFHDTPAPLQYATAE
jgi:DNA-binding NtrC family response regulator